MSRIARLIAGMSLVAALPAGGSAQIAAPLTPYPQCQANKPSSTPCVCGVRPIAICPADAWCTFTPEGAPQCSRTRPLHR